MASSSMEPDFDGPDTLDATLTFVVTFDVSHVDPVDRYQYVQARGKEAIQMVKSILEPRTLH